jgi:Protein of unknown function (DUF2726)
MQSWEIFSVIALLVLLCLVAILLKSSGRRRLPYFSRGQLLTRGEAVFYQSLRRALPAGTSLAPKVRLCDIIDCDTAARRKGFWNRINQKHADFVLINTETTDILLIIELDDATHNRRDRQMRDAFVDQAFAAAGIEILHVKAAAKYSVNELRANVMARVTGM